MPDLREVVLDVAKPEDRTEVRLRVALLPTGDGAESHTPLSGPSRRSSAG